MKPTCGSEAIHFWKTKYNEQPILDQLSFQGYVKVLKTNQYLLNELHFVTRAPEQKGRGNGQSKF